MRKVALAIARRYERHIHFERFECILLKCVGAACLAIPCDDGKTLVCGKLPLFRLHSKVLVAMRPVFMSTSYQIAQERHT
jgi:hypothetical protein